jgi:adenylate kinase
VVVAADAVRRPVRRIVLLGAPGSGKGTQAVLLAGHLDVPTVSTGDMLRAAVAAKSELGERVESVMAAGELVSDALMADVVRARLDQGDTRRGFVLDGYPRTLPQAATLDELLADQDAALDAVVLLAVPEETLVRRALGRQRADDREDIVRERLRVYRSATEPLVARYRSLGLLHRVDGTVPVAEVTSSVLRTLESSDLLG